MRRSLFLFTILASVTSLVACSNSNNNDGGNDAGNNNGTDGGVDGGCSGGTIASVSHLNQLPAAWASATPTDFADSLTGPAAPYMNEIVELNVSSTSLSGSPASGSCPPAFVYTATTTGKSYCDGFYAQVPDGGAEINVLVDDFSFLSSSSTCSSTFNATPLATIRGLWSDYYNSSLPAGMQDNYVIALTACSDVGVGAAYAGTGTPTASTDIHTLLTGTTADGSTVTVSGVVVAAWGPSSSGSFGFALNDPAGGPQAGLSVSRASTSSSCAAAPAIGDYITVTGAFQKSYGGLKL
jgi:hypothetical protein